MNSSPSGDHIERVIPRPQILTVNETDADPKGTKFSLHARVPQPFCGVEAQRRIPDLASIQERAKLHAEEATVVYIFVDLPVGNEIVTAHGSAPLASVSRADMRPHPKVVPNQE